MDELISRYIATIVLMRSLFACANHSALWGLAQDERRRRGRGALVVVEAELLSRQADAALVGVMYVTEYEVEAAEPVPGLGALKAAVRRHDPECSFVLAYWGPLGLSVLTCPWPGRPETN
jgi:hypothetical protein